MTPTRLLVLAVVLVGAAGVATGAPVWSTALETDQTRAHSEKPGTLVPEGYRLAFDGGDVTGVTVLVNNTGDELSGEVRAELVAKNGSVVANGTETAVLGTGGTQEVTVTFSGTSDPTRFARVEVTVAGSL